MSYWLQNCCLVCRTVNRVIVIRLLIFNSWFLLKKSWAVLVFRWLLNLKINSLGSILLLLLFMPKVLLRSLILGLSYWYFIFILSFRQMLDPMIIFFMICCIICLWLIQNRGMIVSRLWIILFSIIDFYIIIYYYIKYLIHNFDN